MSLPMILTCGRIALAPVFFLLYSLAGSGSSLFLIGVWAVFILIEVSDLLDGHFARVFRQESEMGKVLDPMADSLSRLTYFTAFAGTGIMPLWILLIVIYRDVGVAYIRVLTAREKFLMPARASGKLKAWVYASAGGGGIIDFSLRRLHWFSSGQGVVEVVALVLFLLAAAIAVWSLADYAVFFRKFFGKAS